MSHDPTSPGRRKPLVQRADLALAVMETGHAAQVRILSPRTDIAVARRVAGLLFHARPGTTRRMTESYAAILGRHLEGFMPPRDYAVKLYESLLLFRIAMARLGARPDWRPRIAVEGAGEVEAALARGRGVVLWMLPLDMASLLARLVAHDRGWDYHHISHVTHGPSNSRVGIATINRRDCAIESRYGPRLVLDTGRTRAALDAARDVLGRGGTVGFRGIGMGRRANAHPFFDGHLTLAYGAPALARKAEAPLFTVSVRRGEDGPDGASYRLGFEALPVGTDSDLRQVARTFVARLEAAVRRDVASWSVLQEQFGAGPPDTLPPDA